MKKNFLPFLLLLALSLTACIPEAIAFQECPPCVEVKCPPCAEAEPCPECPPCPEVEPCPECPPCPEPEVPEEYNPIPLAVWPKDDVSELKDVFFLCYYNEMGFEYIILYQPSISELESKRYNAAKECTFFPKVSPFPLEFWQENGRSIIGYPDVVDYSIVLPVAP